ncbi:hypothetical protein HK100_008010, partial [Physocladia obscura]
MERQTLYECSVSGWIDARQVGQLVERVAGLTGAAAGLGMQMFTGMDKSKILLKNDVSANATINGPTTNGASDGAGIFMQHELCAMPRASPPPRGGSLRLRSECQTRTPTLSRRWTAAFWAAPQPSRKGQFCKVRGVYQADIIQGNLLEYLAVLDYVLAFEFVRHGFRFHFGNLSILISRLYKFQSMHDFSSLIPVDGNDPETWIVDIASVPVPSESVQPVSDEISAFTKDLRG